jgi:hypothetical protein
MKVLADFHHQDLYYSLQLLFEKRLGWELYHPIGLDWYHEKYWNVYPHPATAEQYLGLHQTVVPQQDTNGNILPEEYCLNKSSHIEDGIYYVLDNTKGKYQKAVTLDKFKDMKFDIILSSMPAHVRSFNRLIQLYQPQAKHIFQIGNPGWWTSEVKNIMCGSISRPPVPGTNIVYYHQEFDLDVFKYVPPKNTKVANSYIHYMEEIDLLNQYRTNLPDWKFTTYGAGFEQAICYTKDIANIMQDSGWTWHMKPLGDGYGHVLHTSYACGRPTIIKKQYYNNMLGNVLLEDGVTCIDIGKRNVQENSKILSDIAMNPETHLKLCERSYQRFKDVVNFDVEEIRIRKFLENLQ